MIFIFTFIEAVIVYYALGILTIGNQKSPFLIKLDSVMYIFVDKH